MRRALRRLVDDVDDLRIAEVAEREPEIQRRPDDDHDIGAAEGGPARLGERESVVGRQRAATHAVREHRHDHGLGRLAQLGDRVTGVHIGSGDDDRLLRRGDQRRGLRDIARIGLDRRDVRDRDRRLTRAVDHFERQVEECRPAVRRQRGGQRGGDGGRYVVGRQDRRGVFRDRGDDRHVIHLLQAAGAPAELRCPAAQHEDGRRVEERARDARDAVGDAGSGGQHREPGPPGQLRDRLGGEHGGLLMADVIERETGLVRRVEQREDMAAGQREHRRHPVRPECGEREVTAVALDRVGHPFPCLVARVAGTLPPGSAGGHVRSHTYSDPHDHSTAGQLRTISTASRRRP